MTILEITNLQKLEEAISGKSAIIDFKATWCGPCKKIAPKFLELSNHHKDIIFISVDVDDATEIVEKFNITSMPTFLFFKEGLVVKRLTSSNYEELKKAVSNHFDM
jgi:thioredoxin 1